jgi:hypothetical protein
MKEDLKTCMTGLIGGKQTAEPKKEDPKPSALVRLIQIKKGKK